MCLKQAAIRTDSVYEPKCVLLKLDIVIETSMTVLASNISGIVIHLQKISRILKIWKSRMIYRKETTDINNSKKLYLIPVTVKLNTISWCWKMGGGGVGWRIWAFHVKSMALHADIIFFFYFRVKQQFSPVFQQPYTWKRTASDDLHPEPSSSETNLKLSQYKCLWG